MNVPPTLPLAPKKLINSSNKAALAAITRSNLTEERQWEGERETEPGALGYRLIAPPTGHLPCHTHARGGQEIQRSSPTICGSVSSQIPLLHPADTCSHTSCRTSSFVSLFHMSTCASLIMLQIMSFRAPLSVLSVSPTCSAFPPV